MGVVALWTGDLARALRLSLRMSVDEFAATLGTSSRGVAKWEANPSQQLALRSQQLLDVQLERAPSTVRERFSEIAQLSSVPLLSSPSPSTARALPAATAVHPQLSRPRASAAMVGWLERTLHQHYT